MTVRRHTNVTSRVVMTDESEPRTAYKYPRGDHPSPTGSCDPGLTWTNTLKRCTLGHLLVACKARRPPRWAPRQFLAPAFGGPPLFMPLTADQRQLSAKARLREPRPRRNAATSR